MSRGVALLMLGRPLDAIEAFNQAKSIYDRDPSWNQPFFRKYKAVPTHGPGRCVFLSGPG